MNQQDSGALPANLETHRVGRQQIDQEKPAQQPAARIGKRARDLNALRNAEEYLPEAYKDLPGNPGDPRAEVAV